MIRVFISDGQGGWNRPKYAAQGLRDEWPFAPKPAARPMQTVGKKKRGPTSQQEPRCDPRSWDLF